jgi:hypothetical protein
VDAAGSGAAWVAAGAAWTGYRLRVRRAAGAHGEDGELLVELVTVASGTGRLLTRPGQMFEPVATVATGELEQRHDFIITQILIGRPGV